MAKPENIMSKENSKTETGERVGSADLLGCPFCGGEAKQEKTKSGYPVMHWVACSKCEASATSYQTPEDAKKQWNTRLPIEICRDHWKKAFKHERANVIRLRGMLCVFHGDECRCDDCQIVESYRHPNDRTERQPTKG